MPTTRLAISLIAIASFTSLFACTSSEQAAGNDQMAMAHGQPAPAGAPKAPSVFDAPQPVGATATCPVLGNTFTITADTPHSEYQGKHVYFCCAGCKPQFDADPKKYLK